MFSFLFEFQIGEIILLALVCACKEYIYIYITCTYKGQQNDLSDVFSESMLEILPFGIPDQVFNQKSIEYSYFSEKNFPFSF